MAIINILRDGTRVEDLTAHVVKELPELYSVVRDIDRRLIYGKETD